MKRQIGTSRFGWGGRRSLPIAFTEHGVAMAASLLKSDSAIQISVEIIRAFIKMRQFLGVQKELTKEFEKLKGFVLKKSQINDQEFRKVWRAIEKLSEPPQEEQKRIGFKLN